MTEEEEEYQPLDIALVPYSAQGIALSDRPLEKQQDESAKNGVEESQAAEMYLYDRPQIPVRREDEALSTSDGVGNSEQKVDDGQAPLEGPRGPQVGSNDSTFGYQTDTSVGHNSWGQVSGNLGERSVEKKKADTEYVQGAYETAKVGTQLPETIQQPFYVNAKQYYRIIKRRYARARLEENIRISRERKPYLHESRHKHAMRRPRGQGGRFLTVAEIEAMKAKESSDSGQSSATATPLSDASKEVETQAPVITQQDTSQNKLPPLRKNDS